MKFFRWILSHLTLILMLSLAVYLYWNSDDTTEPLESSASKTPVSETTKSLDSDVTTDQSTADNSPQEPIEAVAETPSANDDSQPPNDFSKRMQEYREKLRTEEQQAMDKAAKSLALEYASGDEIKYPTDSDIDADLSTKHNNLNVEPFKDSPVNVVKATKTNKTIVRPDKTINQQEDKALEVVIRDSLLPETQALKDNNVTDAVKTKNIKRQIRDRQRQLQSQMVMMVPLEGMNAKINNKSQAAKKKKLLKPIEPVIETAEQGRLLEQARQAFEEKKYKLAEDRYNLLIEQLPELPDIVGELANVYKVQNKKQHYLTTNTQFVTRLVNHNRFNEAWRVVFSTDKLDKAIAQEQRNIIKRKQ
ncbi:hypothetical protein [sulfur-oxidizing endosymbiont of Gigantopelta aegis]|uniref:hypothetical protein n=1 Tax=sulfur-oxidizing endosymbiont of Gigantopelta aegis TaxID=2794934 RepID=UPI0018DE53E0|nr:hypothetical protein [sulfur-oxidizing endosymbiont of Gigantopelta aegis]